MGSGEPANGGHNQHPLTVKLNSCTLSGMDKLDSSLFGWQEWRIGAPIDIFGVPCRFEFLVAAALTLRAHAVGWCEGSSTLCRPRAGHTAIMYFVRGEYAWFHLRDNEARAIFPEVFGA